IPSVDVGLRGGVRTTTPIGASRGAGRPYGTAVIERAVDALAHELGADPIELRMMNLIPRDRHPYATGLTTAGRGPVDYDSGDFARCMDLALDALDMKAARRRQSELRGQGRHLGIGLGNYVRATATVADQNAVGRGA